MFCMVFVLSIAIAFGLNENLHLELQVEICDNAIDDDGNGLIDLNDPGCDCAKPEPQSLIPNPSFEEQNCCPQGRSQLDCAKNWIQASEPTTDYIHECGWEGWENIPAPVPFPDGEGIMGFRDGRNINGSAERNWKEYAGACLMSPLLAGNEYTFEFYLGFVNTTISPAIEIAFFGTTSCDHLPFGIGNQGLGCPTNGPNWQYLNSKRVNGSGWVLTTITIVPKEDIYAIAIGPPCAPNSSTENLYYYFDNLILAESKFFSKNIDENESVCVDDFELSVTHDENATYQWYKDGIAIIGETDSSYKPHLADGNYAVMEYLEGQCNLSKVYAYEVPEYRTEITQTICDDEKYDFNESQLVEPGIYLDTILTDIGCDSIIILDLSVLGKQQDMVSAKIFEGDVFRMENFSFSDVGTYELNLQSAQGCDSLVVLDLAFYKIYIPNIFSPNGDGVNDEFEVFLKEPNLFLNSVSIFNRWGSRVYYSSDLLQETDYTWDGNIANENASPGVYTYVIEINLENDRTKVITGDITIIQ